MSARRSVRCCRATAPRRSRPRSGRSDAADTRYFAVEAWACSVGNGSVTRARTAGDGALERRHLRAGHHAGAHIERAQASLPWRATRDAQTSDLKTGRRAIVLGQDDNALLE